MQKTTSQSEAIKFKCPQWLSISRDRDYLWVYNTKDQDYGYTTQRIGIMGIQHKGSGLWVCNTKDRDYYPAQIYFKNCSLNIFRNISVYSHNFRNNSKLKGRKKTTIIPSFMAFAVNKKLRLL